MNQASAANTKTKQARKPEYAAIRRAKTKIGEGQTDAQRDAFVESLIQRWRDQANR